jgi:hypothetical protein
MLNSCISVILTLNCFTTYMFNVRISMVLEQVHLWYKLRSLNIRAVSDRNHFICCEETTVELGLSEDGINHHHRLYSPGWALASSWGLVTIYFYGVGLLASRPTPTLRARVSLFVWIITLDLSGMGGPTSSIRYCQHCSQDHLTTQASPLRQSRDTFAGRWYQ